MVAAQAEGAESPNSSRITGDWASRKVAALRRQRRLVLMQTFLPSFCSGYLQQSITHPACTVEFPKQKAFVRSLSS
ncbi:hypothetical protein PMIN06_003531 [Paraphaeosphaeria minitans]